MPDVPLPGWPRALREPLAAAYVGLSPAAVQRLRASGDFPAPFRLTTGRIAWLREELDRWLDARAEIAAPSGASDWDG